jgi:hypothetical protein
MSAYVSNLSVPLLLAELHKPCYIVASLAVGQPSGWGGAPDNTAELPDTMQIASIRVWPRGFCGHEPIGPNTGKQIIVNVYDTNKSHLISGVVV